MRRPAAVLLALAALALVLVACGGDDGGEGARTSGATETETVPPLTAAENAGCEKVQAPKPRDEQALARPSLRIDRDKTYRAVVATSCGEFTISLADDRSPKTVASFVHLVRRGFYDGLTFHRIIPGFVIQGGDPQGSGMGGPGYSVVEAPPETLEYTKGVVAMAKTQVEEHGTSGSQFFIVVGEDAGLPPEYAYVGRVTAGMDVVDRISVVPTDPAADDRPVDPVVIRKVTVKTS